MQAWWPVVICQIKVCNPKVKRCPANVALDFMRRVAPKIVPQPQADGGQFDARITATAKDHLVVASGIRAIGDRRRLRGALCF